MTSTTSRKKVPKKEESEQWGKGASNISPDERKIEPIVGVILAASLPLAVIVFWKITIPFLYFCVSTVLGAELLQKINYLQQDVFNLMTSPCPPWISAEERAFLEKQDYHQVRRFHDISKADFEEQIDKGEPFILTEAMRSWPSDWDCHNFIKMYPDVEYFDLQSGSYHPLKDITERSGYEEDECASGEIDMTSEPNRKHFKEQLKQIQIPYFMEDDFSTSVSNGSIVSMDTLYLGVAGTGIPPYVEESCTSFMAAQFSGVTAWSFSRPIVEHDKLSWSKPMRLFLQPGEIVFWFPSMRYHREVADGCSLSLRFRFQMPAPKTFLEDVKTDLSSLHSENGRDNTSPLSFITKCSIVEENGRWVLR
ncbi:uncharacterized protein [Apostichopus japonicus]